MQRSVLGRGFETEALNIYQFIPPHYYPPPSLTAKPEVTYHRLRPQGELRVLASDGLWDMPGNADVVRLVVGTCPRVVAIATPGPKTGQPGAHVESAAAEESQWPLCS